MEEVEAEERAVPPTETSPFVFLRGIDAASLNSPHLTASTDLLVHHNLTHLYDYHVKPFAPPTAAAAAADNPNRLKLVLRKDPLTGKMAGAHREGEREMEATYRDYLSDVTFPPDFSPSTNLEYLAFHPDPNLPPQILPVDDNFLRNFKLQPGKISPDEFDGSILGVAAPDGGVPRPPQQQIPRGIASTVVSPAPSMIRLKVKAGTPRTPGTPGSAGSASKAGTPSGVVPAANVAPGYPGTGIGAAPSTILKLKMTQQPKK